jgi:phage terminase large subunit
MSIVNDGKIKLSKKQCEAWRYLNSPKYAHIAEVFKGGGAGSGKSSFGCIWQIDRRIRYPGTRGLIGRENFPALRDSTLATFFEVAYEFGYRLADHFHYNAQDHIVRWNNGTDSQPPSETHFRYLQYLPSDPDYNRLGSTEYTDSFIDEAPEVEPRAAQVLLSRLRYKHVEYNLTPKQLMTGNPGKHWIKYAFVMDDEGNPVSLPAHRACVLATLRDNPDKAFADRYESSLMVLDRYDRMRLLGGDWNVSPDVQRPFAFAFDPIKHVKPCEFQPGMPVKISVDFNVEPFCATLWHIGQSYAHCFAEISVKEGTIDEMTKRIRALLGGTALMELTGDHNGTNRGIGINSTASLYDGLKAQLRLGPRQLILMPNPSHLKSREDTNFALANFPDLRIDPKCRGLISDLQAVEVDDKGKIIKSDRTNFAQRADLLDTFRYAVNTYLGGWIKAHRDELSRRGALRRPERLPSDGREPLHRIASQWL